MLQGVDVTTEQLIRLRSRARKVSLNALQSNLLPGSRRSAVFGRGMEYEESRKYADGDDARLIDWRVTARTGTAHTKIFREDRQRAIFLVVDLSESMHYGTRRAFKSVVAAEVASILAWAAFDSNDQVAILTVTEHKIPNPRPTRRIDAIHQQLDMLAQSTGFSPANGNPNLAEFVNPIQKQARAGDLVIFISDFFSMSEDTRRALAQLRRKLQLMACWIVDETEKQALPRGTYPISDGNQFSTLTLSSNNRVSRLQQTLSDHCTHIEQLLRRSGIPTIQLSPGEDVAQKLASTLEKWSRRRNLRR